MKQLFSIFLLFILLTIPFKTITQSHSLASEIKISVSMTKTITCGGQIFFTDSTRTRLQ